MGGVRTTSFSSLVFEFALPQNALFWLIYFYSVLFWTKLHTSIHREISLINFFVGFNFLHKSVQDFFVIWHVPLKAQVSGYLDLKFHNLSPYGWKIENMQEGDTLWNFKYKLPETRVFNGTWYKTKKSFTDGGNPIKKSFLSVTLSHFKFGGTFSDFFFSNLKALQLTVYFAIRIAIILCFEIKNKI